MDSAGQTSSLMIETMLQDPNTTEETRGYIERNSYKLLEINLKPEPKWFAYARC